MKKTKILQFGEGNFLRAFFDWMIDIANAKGVTDAEITVVPPRFREGSSVSRLKAQDGVYHVILEGIGDGRPKRETRRITSIKNIVVPADESRRYESVILDPDLRFVVSNTTEAGIRYEADDITAPVPSTFPGKVTALLYRRWKNFDGAHDKGLIFLCCELIENNSTTLREYVLRHTAEAGLPADFAEWVTDSCIFVDTLVDRIVPGFPKDNIDEIKAGLGCDDNCVVKGELYHLWAIGGKGYETVRKELPLDKAGLHVLYLPEIKAFRDKKVRVLNGSHTGMVPVALQMGCETVMDAFNNPRVNRFVSDMVSREVLPMIEGDPAELKAFADSILERFYNPYIKHYLKSIALNSLSKWEARNWPTVKDNWRKTGHLAEREVFTFAALLSLYGPGSGFTPEDNTEHVAAIAAAWNDADYAATVRDILGAGIFLENFNDAVPGFAGKAAEYLSLIRAEGMEKALEQVVTV